MIPMRFPTFLLSLLAFGLAAKGEESLQIGIYEKAITGADPGDITIVLNSLLEQVRLTNSKTIATRYSSRSAFTKALKAGDVDFTPLKTYQYLEFCEEAPLEVIAAPVSTGDDAHTRFIILTHTDHAENPMDSLSEKTIVIDQRWQSPIPLHWLNHYLSDSGATSTDFKKLSSAERSGKAILQVFFKQQHLCVTTEQSFELMAELNPQIKAKLRIVAQSSPYHLFVLCVRKSLDQKVKERIANNLTQLHNSEKGRQILLLSGSKRFDRIKATDLKNTQELLKSAEHAASQNLPAITNNQDPDL